MVRALGPGLITGAADDDPSGIATYSQAGAAYGLGLAWTAPFALPLMTAVQLMCARLALVSGRGLAAVVRAHYPRWLLWMACALVLVANTVNIAADLGGMAEAAEMLTGIDSLWWHVPFAGVILAALAFGSYRQLVRVFKWLTLVLFAYVATALLVVRDWGAVLEATLRPTLGGVGGWSSPGTLTMLTAIFGTTISPYLFFWQAAQSVEQERAQGRETVAAREGATDAELADARTDVVAGMGFSVAIMWFIVVTTGVTLHAAGARDIATTRQAAEALRPLAGDGAYWLFALGLIGTGLLGVPVLAGSAAYAVSEAFDWRASIDDRPTVAPRFFGVLALALLVGMAIDLAGMDAVRMLVLAAVVNGVLAAPLIAVILLACNDRRVMGARANGPLLNLLGAVALLVMTVGAVVTVRDALR